MSVNGPRKEVRKAIGDARRTEGVAYADAGPGEVTPYGGNGGVLPVVDIPVDGGDLSRTGLEESVGNAVVAHPERTRDRVAVSVRIRRGRYAGDRTLTGIRTPDGERGGSDMDRDGHGRGGQRQRTRRIAAGKPRG